MESRTPKEVVRRFIEDGSTDGHWNMDVIEECFSERYFSHTWQGDLAHTGSRMGRYFSSFEFLERLDAVLIAEGDYVVHRTRSRVRHVGEAYGIAPAGREVEVDHVEMWRVEDGKIIEHWGGIGAGHQLFRALTAP